MTTQTRILREIRDELQKKVSLTPDSAKRFFKTQPGDYAEKERFLGVRVPDLRVIAKAFSLAPRGVLESLLNAAFNEERLLALLILVTQYQKADALEKESIYQFYMAHLYAVNNWNLVDASAHFIVGAHLTQENKAVLQQLAHSSDLWRRRVAIVATWYWIRKGQFEYTLQIAQILLADQHDLIHKAVGWMLREVGKKDESALLAFLDRHYRQMPPTMLRYALERLPNQRHKYSTKTS